MVKVVNLEDEGRGEPGLEGLEIHFSSQSPAEGHLGGREGGERSIDGAVTLDEESAVKVDEPQKSLQLLVGVGNGPGGNRRYFCWVQLEAPLRHDVAQK